MLISYEAKVCQGRNCWVAGWPTPELLYNLLTAVTTPVDPPSWIMLVPPCKILDVRILCAANKTKQSCLASRMSWMSMDMFWCCGPGRQIPWSPATQQKDWVLQSNHTASDIWQWVFTGLACASSFKRSSSSCWDLLASSARATCKVCDKVCMLRTNVFSVFPKEVAICCDNVVLDWEKYCRTSRTLVPPGPSAFPSQRTAAAALLWSALLRPQ